MLTYEVYREVHNGRDKVETRVTKLPLPLGARVEEDGWEYSACQSHGISHRLAVRAAAGRLGSERKSARSRNIGSASVKVLSMLMLVSIIVADRRTS